MKDILKKYFVKGFQDKVNNKDKSEHHILEAREMIQNAQTKLEEMVECPCTNLKDKTSWLFSIKDDMNNIKDSLDEFRREL